MTASYHQHILEFKRPSGTSRGILKTKESWFIVLNSETSMGVGECGLLRGLSIDDREDYEEKLKWVCNNIHLGKDELYEALIEFPSIQFGVEMAFKSFAAEDPYKLFPSKFTQGNSKIPINGLIWMGEKAFMKEQIIAKISEGFKCVKMKIGAIDFNAELELLKYIRSEFNTEDIELRVDANGAFKSTEALEKLKQLSDYDLHSIEQPIKQGQVQDMAKLCELTPLPIALDEELIGVFTRSAKQNLIETIKPQYIILKPSFIGGFKGSQEWIDVSEKHNIGWWMTSALESNIGLNAISQFTYTLDNSMPQGLGTGSLYTNNFPSPLYVSDGCIGYDVNEKWQIKI